MFYLGVDVGKKGGLAVVKADPTVFQTFPYSDEKLKEICEIYGGELRATIEAVHSFSGQGVASMFSFGKSYGYVLGMIEAFEIPYQLVSPQKWQKEFSIHSKEDSIAVAKRLFPGINLLPTERSRKEADGMADAINLAEYGRRHMK